ncbi:hypothetical protein H257_13350 [Aphanomyces astaci]|uniref:Uncharacterized protein n=1 Tax=Aphanomyces astaci TaxID=112090 RepID=W4FVF6_APHAT|nr:hypothetical protein H257_13350 [Aphanomyces astaci]ETV71477.1 hypothetical protein H257_13350 [Aphanomyces astaci]|eukprot:XP_009839142.1 hypothetical protein H257_13350 [Aphanomyces astaci]
MTSTYWGAVDPVHRAAAVSVEETMQFYRDQFKTTATRNIRQSPERQQIPATAFSADAASTLKAVLETALEALRQTKSIETRAFLSPTHVLTGAPKSVTAETPAYFSDEYERTLKRVRVKEKFRASRRLHGAVSDAQLYFCDRRPIDRRKPTKVNDDWLSMQASSIDAVEARGKHVCALVADQQHREIDREKRIHQTHNSKYMDAVARVAIERYEAADQLMRILDDYGLIKSSTSAEYLKKTLARRPTRLPAIQ